MIGHGGNKGFTNFQKVYISMETPNVKNRKPGLDPLSLVRCSSEGLVTSWKAMVRVVKEAREEGEEE